MKKFITIITLSIVLSNIQAAENCKISLDDYHAPFNKMTLKVIKLLKTNVPSEDTIIIKNKKSSCKINFIQQKAPYMIQKLSPGSKLIINDRPTVTYDTNNDDVVPEIRGYNGDAYYEVSSTNGRVYALDCSGVFTYQDLRNVLQEYITFKCPTVLEAEG